MWSITIQALFFVSPIFWHIDEIKSDGLGHVLLTIHSLNPIGQLIELSHIIVLSNKLPPLSDWAYTTMFCVGIFLFGFLIFNKFQTKIVEEL